MNLKILFIVFLLLIPVAYSEISISDLREEYNLGDNVAATINISLENPFNGFLKAEIICDSYSYEYYTTPISIETIDIIDIPGLTAFEEMKGKCKIQAKLENRDKTDLDDMSSDDFIVSDSLKVELGLGDVSINPSDKLKLIGSLLNIRDEPIPGFLTVILDDKNYTYTIANSEFNIEYAIPSNIKSGANRLLLNFEDKKGNYYDELVNLDIIPKPTSITIDLNDDIYLPYENINAKIFLHDQAGDKIEKELNVEIKNDKKNFFSGTLTNSDFSYSLPNKLPPGDYILKSVYGNITQEQGFKIAELSEITSKLDGQSVVITNKGNIIYKNTTIISLSGRDNISLAKKVSINPGESSSIDLSKEVPEGDYDVKLPTGEELNNIHLNDNRNVLAKTSAGFFGITGNAIKTVKSIPWGISIMILLLIIFMSMVVLQFFGIRVISKMRHSIRSIFRKRKP